MPMVHGKPLPPVCGRMPVVPSWGTVMEKPGRLNSGETVDAWDFQLQETPCRMGVRDVPHMESCLSGSWVVLIGASQTAVWTQQLANLLSPGALDSLRDGFVTDGVYLHMLDLIFQDGEVVHKTVVYQSGHAVNEHKGHGPSWFLHPKDICIHLVRCTVGLAGAHSETRDYAELPLAYAQLAQAPAYNASLGQWQQSPMFLVVGVGLWYGYAKGCALDWCATRPEIAGLGLEAILDLYTEGMHRYASNSMRYFDLWEFLEQVPEDCLFGHMSPASASFMIQALLSSICPADDVAEGTLVAFVGNACRSRQITPDCPGMTCGGYMYTWDYALSQNCKLVAAVDPDLAEKGYQPMMSGPAMAASWMLHADVVTTTTTTAVTTQHVNTTVASTTLLTTSAAVQTSEFQREGQPLPSSPASGFIFWERLINVRQDRVLAQWVLSVLLLSAAILIARYARTCMKALKIDAMLDETLPFKVGTDLDEPAVWWSEDWGADSPKMTAQRSDAASSEDAASEQRLLSSPASQIPPSPKPVLPSSCSDMVFRMPKGERYAFGLARYLASLHVVMGHIKARGHEADVQLGFALQLGTLATGDSPGSAFLVSAICCKGPQQLQEKPYEYVTIYPVYAVSLLIAGFSGMISGTLPSGWILLMQAWLVQAWVPFITEKGLQMQCWFLSCLVVYWTCFPMLVRRVSQVQLHEAVIGMSAMCSLPLLYLLIPDLFYGNATWYEYHSWGKMRNITDVLVVVIKFHPFCYMHVFILGMLLARLRLLL
ncbi:unnamed protein product, partial [Symbiodinium pilosum]